MGFFMNEITNHMSGIKNSTKYLIEILSAGAVLVGLIFVGFELRQNTAAMEATTLQSSTDASVDWMMSIASDPELTRIWTTPPTELDKLTETERHQLHLLQRSQWFRFQNAYLQWQRETLSEDDWQIYMGYICRTHANTARNSQAANLRFITWEDHRGVLLPRFAEFVESCRIAGIHQDQN
jgi:hypothetical protein